jgi:amino acid transporter
MKGMRRSLGIFEAFGFSLSIIAPTLAMAFTTALTTSAAGRAAPLSYLVGGISIAVVSLSFAVFGRRIAHAGSAFAYVASTFGVRTGFVIGWALMLTYVTLLAGSTALVGSFAAAGLRHAGIDGPNLWLSIAAISALLIVWLAWSNMRLAARMMLVMEGLSVLAILLLALIVLMQVPLSVLPFKPEPARGWSGVGYGMVFAALSFAGFEGATTLGEETVNPGRSIPKAIVGTVIAATLFYVLVSYAVVSGYGLDHVQLLAQSSAPLDVLGTRFISGSFAVCLDIATAASALASAIGCLSAGARILYAVSRSGIFPRLAEADHTGRVPKRCVTLLGGINLAFLLIFSIRSDVGTYSSNIVTIGTLSLILVYISVTAAQALDAARRRRMVWISIGALGTVTLLWPLWNSIYPVAAWPGDMWPYMVTLWVLSGAVIAGSSRALKGAQISTEDTDEDV